MIDVRLLGSGGGMPMPFRHLSSLIMKYNGRSILIDCGEGTQVAMRKFKTGFIGLDLILISHLHGDHIFGLPGLLSTIGNSGRRDPIYLIGPKGSKKVIEGLLLSLSYLPFELNIIEETKEIFLKTDGQRLIICQEDNYQIKLSTLQLQHSIPTLGFSFYIDRRPKFYPEKARQHQVPINLWSKLQNNETITLDNKTYTPDMVLGEARKGIKVSFITDTRPFEEIVYFIRNSDLFICEGTYGDEKDLDKAIKNKHMTFGEAANLAKKADVGKLLITHFSPSLDDPKEFINNAKDIFENTRLGYDGYSDSLTFVD